MTTLKERVLMRLLSLYQHVNDVFIVKDVCSADLLHINSVLFHLHCTCIQLKGKGAYSSLWIGNPPQSYGASPAVRDHTVLPVTRHRWTRPALTPAMQAGTRFTFPRKDGRLSWRWCWLYTYVEASFHPTQRGPRNECNERLSLRLGRCVACVSCVRCARKVRECLALHALHALR